MCAIGDALRAGGSPDDFISANIPGWAENCDPLFPPPISAEEVQRIQNVYVVSFFRRWLNGETAYDFYLEPEYAAANEPAVTYFIFTRDCGEGFEIALVLPFLTLGRRVGRRRSRTA